MSISFGNCHNPFLPTKTYRSLSTDISAMSSVSGSATDDMERAPFWATPKAAFGVKAVATFSKRDKAEMAFTKFILNIEC
jgi:hypothetical protein